jgi:hypothetical protein
MPKPSEKYNYCMELLVLLSLVLVAFNPLFVCKFRGANLMVACLMMPTFGKFTQCA